MGQARGRKSLTFDRLDIEHSHWRERSDVGLFQWKPRDHSKDQFCEDSDQRVRSVDGVREAFKLLQNYLIKNTASGCVSHARGEKTREGGGRFEEEMLPQHGAEWENDFFLLFLCWQLDRRFSFQGGRCAKAFRVTRGHGDINLRDAFACAQPQRDFFEALAPFTKELNPFIHLIVRHSGAVYQNQQTHAVHSGLQQTCHFLHHYY